MQPARVNKEIAIKIANFVLKAVANVLQDEGYIITNAESELGLITAEKEASIEDGTEKFFAILFAGANAATKRHWVLWRHLATMTRLEKS